jgi:molecular chaperone DnaJ
LSVNDHKFFKRENDDIYIEVNVPVGRVILGTEIEVPTLDGKALLKIPAGTQPGTLFRLKGKGVTRLRGHGRGDQHVRVQVQIPTTLSAKEKTLIEEFSALSGDKKTDKNFFDHVKHWF